MCDKLKKIGFYLLISLFVVSTPGMVAIAQDNQEVKAIQLFHSGEFQKAENLLKEMLEQNSESPISNYYYGASRTETGHYGEEELNRLLVAGNNITPDRLHYYLGIQYHARSNWNMALKHYNIFRQSVPVSEQKELNLDKLIQYSFNHENPFTDGITAVKHTPGIESPTDTTLHAQQETKHERLKKEKVDVNASPNDNLIPQFDPSENMSATHLTLPREALPNLPGVKASLPDGEAIEFQVNSQITYLFSSQFQTKEGKELFLEGMELKQRQEQVIKKTNELRTQYKNTQSEETKQTIATKIIELENESYFLLGAVKKAFNESRNYESEYWDSTEPVSKSNFLLQQEQIKAALNEERLTNAGNEKEVIIGFLETKPEVQKKAKDPDLIYKIQIGAYSKGVPAYRQRLFNKLAVIRTIENYTDENGVVVYTTGNLNSYEDAVKMQNQLKQEGIQDARVVPYFNGKRITLEVAKQMEMKNDI